MTTPLFTKLQWKPSLQPLAVLGAPDSFEPELTALGPAVKLLRMTGPDGADAAALPRELGFAIAFVTTLAQVQAAVAALVPCLPGDVPLWLAYPKASSKRQRCEFNRDTGWAALGAAGFECVRQVAIDEDWSALRFRRVEFIAQLTRDPSRRLIAAR